MNWMTIPSATAYLKKEGGLGMIGESTIRTLIRLGFPCVHIGNRVLINVDSFFDDLITFSNSQMPVCDKHSLEVTTA